jgi:hypothetical protein
MVTFSAIESTEDSRVRIRRVFPTTLTASHDPFVLLDEFFIEDTAGFPLHHHRGFEAVTYVLDGCLRHTDDLGNHYTVGPGGVHRFCAGKGMCHAEMPVGKGLCHGLQLWINLPAALKETPPTYQRVIAERIPRETPAGGVLRHIVGGPSPVEVQADVHWEDVRIEAGSSCQILLPDTHEGFVYVYEGIARIAEMSLEAGSGVELEHGGRQDVWSETTTRLVVISGTPLGRQIVMHDGIVE